VLATTFRDGLLAAYPTWGALPNAGHLSGLEAITVTYYNGVAGLPKEIVNRRAKNSCWLHKSLKQNGQTVKYWKFEENVNRYCEKVNQQID